VSFIHEYFVPVGAHIKERLAYFHRFNALWTPTVLVLDSDGVERARIEGYLPNSEFRAHLEIGLGRMDFMHKQWGEAQRRYAQVEQKYSNTSIAPEAMYWRGVSRYRATNDHKALDEIAGELKAKHPESVWTKKASIWSH
jgi:hypothetical protein